VKSLLPFSLADISLLNIRDYCVASVGNTDSASACLQVGKKKVGVGYNGSQEFGGPVQGKKRKLILEYCDCRWHTACDKFKFRNIPLIFSHLICVSGVASEDYYITKKNKK